MAKLVLRSKYFKEEKTHDGRNIMINANPGAGKARYETNWLNEYWKAKCEIDELRSIYKMLEEELSQNNKNKIEAQRKVDMYLELFPDIDPEVKS